MPPGSSAPTRASGTFRPAAALGAPHTICSFAGAVVHFADAQLVGVGMGRDFDDVAHDHAAEGGRGGHGVFDFQAGHGEPVRKFFGGDGGVDQRTQPGFGKLHDQPSVIR